MLNYQAPSNRKPRRKDYFKGLRDCTNRFTSCSRYKIRFRLHKLLIFCSNQEELVNQILLNWPFAACILNWLDAWEKKTQPLIYLCFPWQLGERGLWMASFLCFLNKSSTFQSLLFISAREGKKSSAIYTAKLKILLGFICSYHSSIGSPSSFLINC